MSMSLPCGRMHFLVSDMCTICIKTLILKVRKDIVLCVEFIRCTKLQLEIG